MFITRSDADADWVEEIEIVSPFECEFVFNPLGVYYVERELLKGLTVIERILNLNIKLLHYKIFFWM